MITDLFAGPGGFDEGIRRAGYTGGLLGVEKDPIACATAIAAGHSRLQLDIRQVDPSQFVGTTGQVASPPCPSYSTAGNGKGRDTMHLLIDGLAGIQTSQDVGQLISSVEDRMTDDRSSLVLEPLRFALATSPHWIAWEQVPPVLPIWEACARVLRNSGYSVATGVLSAEQFGVPQTRKRAILVARKWEYGAAKLPAPTHSPFRIQDPDRLTPGLPKAVSILDAMGPGWRPEKAPRSSTGPWQFAGAGATARTTAGQIPRDLDMPAHTITGKATAVWTEKFGPVGSGYNVTVAESGVLQSFRADYPWQGKKLEQYRQVGDAIPPMLAEAVVRAIMPGAVAASPPSSDAA